MKRGRVADLEGAPQSSQAQSAERTPRDGKVQHPPTRGYIKLSQAAEAFNFDFRGKTVLDIGSSTGGFTKYALDHGARKVIAVEKGTNQMESPLRFDPRIELHEKTDIFNVTLKLSLIPDIITIDVSFISLRAILSYAKQYLTSSQTDILAMFKPQFEAKPYQLNKGVIKNEKIRREIIKEFESWLKHNDFVIINKRDNALHGKYGNRERFYLLKKQ